MNEDTPTALVSEQSAHLKKSLKRFDIFALMVAAVLSVDLIAPASVYGAEAFTWTLVLVVLFLLPYGILFAETGAAFSEEGGAYTWVRNALGRKSAAIAAILTWVTQPVWVGGTMSFLAVATWDSYISPITRGSAFDYGFKIVFIWVTVLAAVISLSKGKWLPTAGAIVKVAILAFFVLTTLIYAVEHGVSGASGLSFSPTLAGLFGLTPVLLFAYLGFESSNSAAGEMTNPARDVPISLARSASTAALCYLIPILAIVLVVPADQITGLSGLLDAVITVYSVYGPAAGALVKITGILFVFVLMSQGSAWMIISDRMQAIAAADGAFFGGFFGRFHQRLGTPVRVNVLSGVVASAFMLAAKLLSGTSAAIFGVVLTISITTFLLSYLLVIPAAVRLRFTHRDVVRPYRAPVSDRVYAGMGAVCFFWILLGSWVAVFPGTLEAVFSMPYDFHEIWGVSQAQFEIFTLGTLAALLILGSIGYARGARVRKNIHRTSTRQPAFAPTTEGPQS